MHDNHRVSTDLSLHVAERLYAAIEAYDMPTSQTGSSTTGRRSS